MPTPSELEAALAKHRAELDAGERAAADRVVNAYGRAWADTQRALEQLLAKMQAAIDAGEQLSPAWLYQERRLRIVLERLEDALRARWPDASAAVLDAQRGAVDAAQRHAHELVEGQTPGALTGTFEAMPEEALADLVGYASDGSPLRALLDQLPGQLGQTLEQHLVSGLAQGLGPRQIAARARAATGMELQRALTITRTEQLRAYRESTRRALEANPQVVAGWTWFCACDRRSCAVCWAMHGRQFPPTEHLDGHPNCRCAMVPLTKTWEALGFTGVDETRLEPDPGVQQFAQLPEADQLAILGPGKLAAYKDGRLHLTDLVERPDSPRWGTMRRERTLTEVDRLRAQGRLHSGVSDRLGPGRLEPRQVAGQPGDLHAVSPPPDVAPDLPAYRREFDRVRGQLPDDPAEWGYSRRPPTPDERLALERDLAAARADLERHLARTPEVQAQLARSIDLNRERIARLEDRLASKSLVHDLELAQRHEALVRDAGEVIEREALERMGPELERLEARRLELEGDVEAAVGRATEARDRFVPLDKERAELARERAVVARQADQEYLRVSEEVGRAHPDASLAERQALTDADPRVVAGNARVQALTDRIDAIEPRYRAVRDEVEATRHASNEARRALDAHAGEVVQLRREKLLEVLSEVRPMGPAPELTGNAVWNLEGRVPGDVRTALNGAADYYPREWIARSDAWGTLKPAKVRRGFYEPKPKGSAAKIRLSDGQRSKAKGDPPMLSVALHELGHRAENVNPGVRVMEHAFVKRRTEGERLEAIYRGSREKGYRDEFVEHYIGKVYGGGPTGDWEVLSVGMEGVFTSSYDVWADTEMRRLILGLVAAA